MTNTQLVSRLQKQLIHLIALEAAIERKLQDLLPEVSDHAEASTLLRDFQALPKDQRKALEGRLDYLNENSLNTIGSVTDSVAGNIREGGDYLVSAALQSLYTMFNQAVIGYATLHSLATRFLDSVLIADEGTSFHLARQHTQNYVQAIQQISRLLHDVVIWELDQEGSECQCICPSCGVGICLCALAGRSFLSSTWSEAGPIAEDEGISVQLPKQNSPATKAGLRRGDVILGADGQEFESWGDIQSVLRNAETGEEIRLTVRRESDELEEIVLIRP